MLRRRAAPLSGVKCLAAGLPCCVAVPYMAEKRPQSVLEHLRAALVNVVGIVVEQFAVFDLDRYFFLFGIRAKRNRITV